MDKIPESENQDMPSDENTNVNKDQAADSSSNNISKSEDDVEKTCQMEAPDLGGDEATIVHDANETKMGEIPDMEMLSIGAKFVIMSSQRKGEEFYITSNNMEIGRGEGCDLKLDFPGISRKHFRTSIEDGKVSIEDIGSKYGTLVGKTKIDAPRVLKSGDIIQVGELTLRYETAEGIGAAGLLQNKTVLIAGGSFLGLIVLLLLIKLISPSPQPQTPIKPIVAQDPKVESVRLTEDIQDLIYQAQTLAKEGNLEYALQKLDQALQSDPNNKQALNYKEIWGKQFDQMLRIEKAKGLIDIGSFEQAKMIINEVLSSSAGNTEAQILLKRILKLSSSQEAMQVLKESRSLLSAGRFDESESILSQIKDPDLKGEVNDIMQEISKAKKLEEIHNNALLLFNSGDLNKSLNSCKDGLKIYYKHEKLSQLKSKIQKIQKLRKNADEQLNSSSPLNAKQILIQITETLPSTHPYYIKASNDLTSIEAQSIVLGYVGSQQALKKLANGNLKAAMTELNQLVIDFPENPNYRIIRDEFKVRVDNLAKALFRAGYILENSDPLKAKEIWQRLLNMIPENHPYAKKVKTKIRI